MLIKFGIEYLFIYSLFVRKVGSRRNRELKSIIC